MPGRWEFSSKDPLELPFAETEEEIEKFCLNCEILLLIFQVSILVPSCAFQDLFLFVADGIGGRPYRREVVEELQRWQADGAS